MPVEQNLIQGVSIVGFRVSEARLCSHASCIVTIVQNAGPVQTELSDGVTIKRIDGMAGAKEFLHICGIKFLFLHLFLKEKGQLRKDEAFLRQVEMTFAFNRDIGLQTVIVSKLQTRGIRKTFDRVRQVPLFTFHIVRFIRFTAFQPFLPLFILGRHGVRVSKMNKEREE